MKKSVYPTFNQNLGKMRREKGVTSKEVADYLSIPDSTYQSYETTVIPKPMVVMRLAEYFNVSLDWLMGREGPTEERKALEAASWYTGLSEKMIVDLHYCQAVEGYFADNENGTTLATIKEFKDLHDCIPESVIQKGQKNSVDSIVPVYWLDLLNSIDLFAPISCIFILRYAKLRELLSSRNELKQRIDTLREKGESAEFEESSLRGVDDLIVAAKWNLEREFTQLIETISEQRITEKKFPDFSPHI